MRMKAVFRIADERRGAAINSTTFRLTTTMWELIVEAVLLMTEYHYSMVARKTFLFSSISKETFGQFSERLIVRKFPIGMLKLANIWVHLTSPVHSINFQGFLTGFNSWLLNITRFCRWNQALIISFWLNKAKDCWYLLLSLFAWSHAKLLLSA